MPSHYGSDDQSEDKKMMTKSSGKMSESQKADLKKHMDSHKKKGMSVSEMKSHRMKMMSRMRKGMTISQAHKDIMK